MVRIGPPASPMSGPAGPSSADDFSVLDELLGAIERDPNAVEPRRLLAYQYEAYGWSDAAADMFREILAINPSDKEATAWLVAQLHSDTLTPLTRSPRPKSTKHDRKDSAYASSTPATLNQLQSGYMSLMENADNLLKELAIYQELCPDINFASQIADLKALSEGRVSTIIKVKPPPTAKTVAAKIKTGVSALDTAFGDLEATARWTRNEESREDPDKTRDAVRKRAEAIKTNLPAKQAQIVDAAFMHVEHEILGKTYQNEGNTTMLGDSISSILRSEFWVSEDGFAWDMSELASAIQSNGGVMRNPLSRQMFTAQDVKSIVRHKSGLHLAALQAKQQQLTKGVRKDTVDKLEVLAKVLLDDQSDNAAPSRVAIDEFSAFLATLPDEEQTALYNLRVPASDSHTGASFDVSIGKAVDDAKANVQCWHKTGDHLRQAATYLRKSTKGMKMPGSWN